MGKMIVKIKSELGGGNSPFIGGGGIMEVERILDSTSEEARIILMALEIPLVLGGI